MDLATLSWHLGVTSGRGSPLHSLEAMNRRAAIVTSSVLIVGWLAWTLMPAFPSPETLMLRPLEALTKDLGAPARVGASSVVWEKSRGLGLWSLRAQWRSAANLQMHPDTVSRCFRIRWAPEQSSFCQASAWLRTHVMASNFRWSGP